MCYCASRLPSCEPIENALEYDSVNDCYKAYRKGAWIKYTREFKKEIHLFKHFNEEGFNKLK
jgi:hypothetical protein